MVPLPVVLDPEAHRPGQDRLGPRTDECWAALAARLDELSVVVDADGSPTEVVAGTRWANHGHLTCRRHASARRLGTKLFGALGVIMGLEEFAERRARTGSHVPAFIGLDEAGAQALAAELKLRIEVYPDAVRARNMDYHTSRIRVSINRKGRVVSATAG